MNDEGYEEYYRVGGMKAKAMTRGEYFGWKPGDKYPEEYTFITDKETILLEDDLKVEGYAWETHHGFTGWSSRDEFEKLYQKVK